MSASTPFHHPALLGLIVAALSMSGMAHADPVHPPPPHKPVGHTRAALHRPAGHGGRAVHPAPVVRRPPPPVVTPPPVPVPSPVVPPPPARGTSTGLPLPRFAALRADSVYLRRGPGSRYPIEWVYKRRDLPVRIEREFDVWRLIEDSDGIKGWVHQATLVGTRSFVILGPAADVAADAPANPPADAAPVPDGSATPSPGPPGSQVLRSAPQPDAPPVAVLEPGVIGRMRSCGAGADWCRVTVKDYAGWLPRRAVWGLLPDETVTSP